MINWEVILWTCITVGVLVGIFGLILAIISAKNIKKSTSNLKNVHTELKIGSKIMFCGGIYGKIVSIEDETVHVEIAKNTVIKISRFSIQSIL